ncbi:MAG: hypothetical protein OXH15_15750 [Gammaproteobacteria bacterium]|nr:hypothetical protein [Gammaproteobacteria bacterium]
MTFWLFVITVAAATVFWMRGARRRRNEWLRALNLLGKWELDAAPTNGSPAPRRGLTLSGELAGGTYVARDGDVIQRGNWRLRGHTLYLEPTEGDGAVTSPASYELRLFDKGKIGLDGPGRTREVYVKRESNVIPLRVRK